MSEPGRKTSASRILLVYPTPRNFIFRRYKVAELLVEGEAHPKLEYQRDNCWRECRRPDERSRPTALETNSYSIVSSTALKVSLVDLLSVIKRFMKITLASIRFITTFQRR